MDVKTMIFLPLTILAILVFLVALIIMAVDDIKSHRSFKRKEKHCEKLENYYKKCELEEKDCQYIAIDDVIDLIKQYQINSPIEYTAEEILNDLESKLEEAREK